MADTKSTDHSDAGADLTNQRSSSRPGSITQEGKDINTSQTHKQRMEGVETTQGHQGTPSKDFDPDKANADRDGFGMQDTDRRPADRDNAQGDAQVGASPLHDSRYSRDEDRSRGSVSAQPGQQEADIKDEHPERPGHATPEGKAQNGKGNDERGEYGKGSANTQPGTAG